MKIYFLVSPVFLSNRANCRGLLGRWIKCVETALKAAVSREHRAHRKQLEEQPMVLLCACSAAPSAALAVGSAACPFHRAPSREYSWIQSQMGWKRKHCPLDTALLFFACWLLPEQAGLRCVFFPVKGHRKIFPASKSLLVGYCL